jgi:hypothetical protein
VETHTQQEHFLLALDADSRSQENESDVEIEECRLGLAGSFVCVNSMSSVKVDARQKKNSSPKFFFQIFEFFKHW